MGLPQTRIFRRLASGWRRGSAYQVSLLCSLCAVASASVLGAGGANLPTQLKPLELVSWSGSPPPVGSKVVVSPAGQQSYYLSRGPVVHLIELEGTRVHRAWVWRLEDAESLRERWAPVVDLDHVLVSDLHGDVAVFDRATGGAWRLPSRRNAPVSPAELGPLTKLATPASLGDRL